MKLLVCIFHIQIRKYICTSHIMQTQNNDHMPTWPYALTRKHCVLVFCFGTLLLQDHVRFICHFEYKCTSHCLRRSLHDINRLYILIRRVHINKSDFYSEICAQQELFLRSHVLNYYYYIFSQVLNYYFLCF